MAFNDAQAFHWHGHRVDVMHIPGHTQGAVAYYLAADNLIFTGDTLFSAGCGRLLEGSAAQLHESLTRLSHLPDAVLVYGGHEYTEANIRFALTIEPQNEVLASHAETVAILRSRNLCTYPSAIGFENAINPFLRTYLPVMRRTLDLPQDATDLDVFTELRARKDKF
jgi:hydroxyacylglutathione hydrolase